MYILYTIDLLSFLLEPVLKHTVILYKHVLYIKEKEKRFLIIEKLAKTAVYFYNDVSYKQVKSIVGRLLD